MKTTIQIAVLQGSYVDSVDQCRQVIRLDLTYRSFSGNGVRFVLMPAEVITLLSQWPMVATLTGLWGLWTEIHSGPIGVLIAFDHSPFDLIATQGLHWTELNLGPLGKPNKRPLWVVHFLWFL